MTDVVFHEGIHSSIAGTADDLQAGREGEEGRRGGGEGEDTHVMQSARERSEHFVAVTYNVVPSSEEGEESGDNGRHA